MHIPLRITFRDMAPSEWIAAYVRASVDKLEKLSPLTSCAVTVAMPHRHHHDATPIVRLAVTSRGRSIVLGRHRDDDPARSVRARIDGVFSDARRVLGDHARPRRRESLARSR